DAWSATTEPFAVDGRTGALETLAGDKATGKLTVDGADRATGTVNGKLIDDEVDKPEFEKKIKDTNDTTGETSKWQDSADYDIGDAVPYRLTAITAEDVTSYKKYHLTFKDRMEESLTFNEDSVKVYVGGTEVPADAYELSSDEHSFALTLAWQGEDGATIVDERLNGIEVAVEFTATLNEAAKLGKEGNVNEARLAYSNNPTSVDDTDEGQTPWDFVIAFTYKVQVNKVDKNDKALEGAEFKLQKKLADGSLKDLDLKVDANTFTATGLDDGTYVLTETKAPTGYKLILPIEFTVTADHNIEWTDEFAREEVLASLTGDVATGEIKLEADEALEGLTGNVVNEQVTKNKGELKVKKNLTGRAWKDGDKFEFTATAVGNAPKLAKTKVTITNATAGATESFGEIEFTKPGTYTYTVKETKGTISGITYDTAEHRVTFKVVDDGKGNLVADKDSALIQTVEITNTYKETPKKTTTTSKLPKTGDILNQPLMYGLAVGGLAIVAYGIYRKRRKDEE
ncbi:MAG: isopeptide-forming domain-containing fimbrial protein, partial [Atopobiaceae bacterium]|nr:isopeptide-forming domain-containing fimbrial protein [Atopobiaceae bacterium]